MALLILPSIFGGWWLASALDRARRADLELIEDREDLAIGLSDITINKGMSSQIGADRGVIWF